MISGYLKHKRNQFRSKQLRKRYEAGEITRGRQSDGPVEPGELARTAPVGATRLRVVVSRREGVAYALGEDRFYVSSTISMDGAAALARAFVGDCDLSDFRFHAAGVDGAKDLVTRPQLVDEVGIRGAGVNRLISERTMQSVGIVTFEDFHLVREWGLFNRDGVMFDRMLTPEIVVGPGECLQFEYELTFPTGGAA